MQKLIQFSPDGIGGFYCDCCGDAIGYGVTDDEARMNAIMEGVVFLKSLCEEPEVFELLDLEEVGIYWVDMELCLHCAVHVTAHQFHMLDMDDGEDELDKGPNEGLGMNPTNKNKITDLLH